MKLFGTAAFFFPVPRQQAHLTSEMLSVELVPRERDKERKPFNHSATLPNDESGMKI